MAYSLDLRTRIVNAVGRNEQSKRESAKLFGVHESFIYKLLRQKRAGGAIAPLPHGAGTDAKLKAQHLTILSEIVAKAPEATLDELRAQMKKQARGAGRVATIWRGLENLALSRKKSPSARPKPPRAPEPSLKRSSKGSQ